jgi:hypothetical protein
MPKKSKKGTTLVEIENSLMTEGVAFFRNFRKRNPHETIYAFLIELSGVGYAAAAAIATEESLARFAQECADDYDGDVELAKNELRWAGPENGWYQSDDKHFRNTNQLLELAEESELYPEYNGTLEKIALSAIQRMVTDGVFGSPGEREKMVVGICHTGGDNSEEDFLQWASVVNAPAVIQRLEAELKKGA